MANFRKNKCILPRAKASEAHTILTLATLLKWTVVGDTVKDPAASYRISLGSGTVCLTRREGNFLPLNYVIPGYKVYTYDKMLIALLKEVKAQRKVELPPVFFLLLGITILNKGLALLGRVLRFIKK